jgi:bacillithiol biosynthesis deacetylase BshB1
MNLDVIVFSAHPDDAELSMGGTIARLTKNNFKVGMIDLTRGELGTRGTPEIRQREAFNAAIQLKVSLRENLEIPDGDIRISKENITKVVISLRKYKPRIIFAPFHIDRHPDHSDANALIKKSVFYSGLSKIKTFDKEVPQQPHRPQKIYYYMQTYIFEPSFIVDISDTFEQKFKAIECYSSQFYNPKSKEPETFISRPEFISQLKARAEFYGFQINKKYGEPFFTENKIELSLSSLFE